MSRRRKHPVTLDNRQEQDPQQIIDIISSSNSVLLKSELEDTINGQHVHNHANITHEDHERTLQSQNVY